MKNVVSAIFVSCAMSVAVGVSAQGQPGTQGSEPRTPPPATSTQSPTTEQRPGAQRQADQKVTISGCIQNAPAATGAAASTAAAAKYVLNNAKMAGGAANATVGTSGTTAASKYRLEGDDKTISTHLNHQVEITGTVQNSSASATGAGATAGATAGSAAAEPMLKVDSVKMVSAMCQP
jgi:hypothetical protein